MQNKSVLIIGGGLGGLFTGAILAKEGLKVTVLEKNVTIGGGLQSFKRFGEIFDTGMHVIGGMQHNGNINKICKYLGIIDKVRIKDVDRECTDYLYFAEDKHYYAIPKGKDNFVEKLSEEFPHERENLRKYVNAIYEVTDNIDLFNLRPQQGFFSVLPEKYTTAASDFIAQYIQDEKLRSVIAYMNPFYGGRKDETPAFIHAIVNVLYLNGPSRFVDGSYHFADLLAEVIENNGGKVLTKKQVEVVRIKDKKVQSVVTADNSVYEADYYISAIHPCTLIRLFDDKKAFPKYYRERLDEIPNSYSAFSVYIKLKPNSFPYINHSEYFMSEYNRIWDFGNTNYEWPLGFLVMTPPDTEGEQEYATKVLVTAPMSFNRVKAWENTQTGKRGEDYLEWKKQCAQLLLDKMEEIHPGFSKCIDKMETASPLSIRDYYGVKEGALAGYSKDCKNLALSHVPVITKLPNLYLTGQNNNLHGFCGVPLTAITTAEAILGLNSVINKINEANS